MVTIVGCVLVFCILFSGCTSPSQAQIQPVQSPFVTAVAETTQPITVVTTTVEPVVTLPPQQAVAVLVSKDRPTGKITFECTGDPSAMAVVQMIKVQVTLANGNVVDKQLTNADSQIPNHATIVIPGTLDGTDHAVVWVTSNGVVYKVLDQDISTINPY